MAVKGLPLPYRFEMWIDLTEEEKEDFAERFPRWEEGSGSRKCRMMCVPQPEAYIFECGRPTHDGEVCVAYDEHGPCAIVNSYMSDVCNIRGRD